MILMVGATGDLGQRVTSKLATRGESVRAVVRPGSEPPKTVHDHGTVGGDLTDAASLVSACQGVSTVVFTATAIGRRLAGERVSIREVDEVGGLALVAAAERAGVERFVFMSFPGADSGVGTSLERAKLAVERRLAASAMPSVIIRADAFQEVHLGPLARFDVAGGKVSIIGRGNCKRRWIATEDVAELVAALAVETDAPGEVEVGGPQAISKNELVTLAEQAGGHRIKTQHMPRAVARLIIKASSRFNDALASALGAGLHQDLVPATWDDTPLRERGIQPVSPSDVIVRTAAASRLGD